MAIKMGFEGVIYTGTAGTTAGTLITDARDVKLSIDPEMGNTTVRGDSSAPPVDTEQVTALKASITLSLINNTAGVPATVLQALLGAGAAGTAVAIRMKDYVSGKGYDGDCNVKWELGAPLKGEQTFDFTFTPNRVLRVPQLYV